MQQSYRDIQEGINNYVYLGTGIFLTLALLFVVFIIISVRRRKRLSMEKEQLRIAFEKELLHTQLEIQEQTLKTISQEIHDNIGQALSLAKLNLNTMDTASPEELQAKIVNSKNLVSKAIQDLRDLSRTMNTDHIAALGFTRSLEMELEIMRKSGFKSAFRIEGNVQKLEPRRELILFRIVQEVLNNVIKHADAETITVTAKYEAENLKLTVQDNGRGFDRKAVAGTGDKTAGQGLQNMESRSRIIGANFSIVSKPGSGTTIIIDIPYTNPVKL